MNDNFGYSKDFDIKYVEFQSSNNFTQNLLDFDKEFNKGGDTKYGNYLFYQNNNDIISNVVFYNMSYSLPLPAFGNYMLQSSLRKLTNNQ